MIRLISCGSSKMDQRAVAANLYIGNLFKMGKKWAESYPDDRWAILSAKWGLVFPDEVLFPYDFTFKKAPEGWAEKVLERIPEETEILVAAPTRYVMPLIELAPDRVRWAFGELENKAIGFQQQWLKRNTNQENEK